MVIEMRSLECGDVYERMHVSFDRSQEAQGPFDVVVHKATDQLEPTGERTDGDGRVRFAGANTERRESRRRRRLGR